MPGWAEGRKRDQALKELVSDFVGFNSVRDGFDALLDGRSEIAPQIFGDRNVGPVRIIVHEDVPVGTAQG